MIPYRQASKAREFAIFLRTDGPIWQFVAGGGESGERVEQTALRELREETGTRPIGGLLSLDSKASIPKQMFSGWREWPQDLDVITEHSFGADIGQQTIVISGEHIDYRWLDFDEVSQLLTFDSNKTALEELNFRLDNTE